MRFMIVDTVYEAFLKALYQQPGLANRSFAEQQAAQAEGFFNSAGTWAAPLRALGHEVLDFTANNLTMQLCWMIENDLLGVAKNCADGLIFGQTIIRQRQETDWQLAFLAEQVELVRLLQ